MASLTPQEIRHFHERLQTERHAIRSRITARNRDIQGTVQEESGVGDAGDESTRIYDREGDTDANALDVRTLEQVDRALARIDAGTYGVSEVSGKAIPLERLEAVPSRHVVDESNRSNRDRGPSGCPADRLCGRRRVEPSAAGSTRRL